MQAGMGKIMFCQHVDSVPYPGNLRVQLLCGHCTTLEMDTQPRCRIQADASTQRQLEGIDPPAPTGLK